ncbi:response regulator [Shewanella sp. C32]|uniref:Response regulator n=1 Tax=Shewanella electrica TaxID=515560 RepID=A0ABT2FGZ0_9GAMM|nr:response regulator [Shewanella electrica]MCH1923502.1 response regulator [Shewanella electrica]MCS4555599.1 response regulator [Shewanella electrica]
MNEPKATILLIDDDATYLSVLQRRLRQASEFEVITCQSLTAALALPAQPLHGILLDMMLDNESGLAGITALKQHFTPRHLIMLTGYASIATTVEAMRRGATDYLAKPVGLNELLQRLQQGEVTPAPATPMTPAQVEWEHIQRVLLEHDGNISNTAKALGIHRRTLQRKLQKYAPVR